MSFRTVSLKQHAVTARIVWPVAVVLVSMLLLAFLALLWTGKRSDELAIERQTRQIQAILDLQSRQALDALASLAAPERLSVLRYGSAQPLTLPDNQPLNFVALFDPTDRPIATGVSIPGLTVQSEAALLAPVVGELRARLTGASLRRTSDPDATAARSTPGVTRLIAREDALAIVVARPIEASADAALFGSRILAGTGTLSLDTLQGMLEGSGLSGLRLTGQAGPDEASIPIRGSQVDAALRLAWTPDQPGLSAIERIMPMLLIAIIVVGLFSALMFSHVRKVTTDLVAREAKANHLAHHDALSGLANRSLFIRRLDDELAQLNRKHEGVAVIFLDLDKFKDINDTFGHAAGDHLICTVARRIEGVLRGSDLLARFGGDEFAIVQTHVSGPNDSATLANRILDVIHEPAEMAGTPVQIGVSMGIALAPENASERDRLMHMADLALYRAKHEGRNRYAFFEVGMDHALRLRKMVEEDLRGAIERSELRMAYQPQYSADGARIVGVEALVRWTHPVHGEVPPSDFIPVAEERGMIGALGEWVLRQACRDARAWNDLTVAVNVSPIQFRQKDFVASVIRILDQERIDPTRVELELTEGVIVDDADAAENAMMDLRAAGLRFALDDFGTGYSSLIYLRRFAFDKIKIDRSFLESMETTGESAILVHSIVHLGRALGLTVTAEGVETTEQQRFLQAVGCHQLQGYLFCRPVPAARITELLAAGEQPAIEARAVA